VDLTADDVVDDNNDDVDDVVAGEIVDMFCLISFFSSSQSPKSF
jgi:hypothetical protein